MNSNGSRVTVHPELCSQDRPSQLFPGLGIRGWPANQSGIRSLKNKELPIVAGLDMKNQCTISASHAKLKL